VKGKKEKSTTELWLEKFHKKTTNLPEPFPHELVDRLEKYLDVSFYSIEVLDLSLWTFGLLTFFNMYTFTRALRSFLLICLHYYMIIV
jgi:hypothetical protein